MNTNWLEAIGLRGKSAAPAEETDHNHTGSANGGGFVAMHTGRLVSLLDPQPEQIEIDEIAHNLSQIARFGGSTRVPYSVAQHSLHCAAECVARYPLRQDLAFSCLMHDAAEAYVGDIVRPVKNLIAALYVPIERRIQDAIWRRYEYEPDGEAHIVIKEIDDAVCMTEAAVLMRGSGRWDWGFTQPARIQIRQEHPPEVAHRFVETFYRLCPSSNLLPLSRATPSDN